MRAVSHSEQTARLMGVNVDLTISFTFFIGAALAGLGGMLWGLRYGKLEPLMGALPGLKAFTAAVLGGIGSIPGAVLGGIVLGVLEALCQGYLPDRVAGYKDAVAFVALIAILLVKPSGLLGRFEGEKV
jgi:branched-chain amino acid transport system permease protein